MGKQYRNFVPNLNPVENRLFEILRIEKTEDELKIVLGTSEPRLFYKCVYFRGLRDFVADPLSDEDTDELPQTFNSFDYIAASPDEELYRWILLGDGCEWSFIAPFSKLENC